jgi:hypothetical protein
MFFGNPPLYRHYIDRKHQKVEKDPDSRESQDTAIKIRGNGDKLREKRDKEQDIFRVRYPGYKARQQASGPFLLS